MIIFIIIIFVQSFTNDSNKLLQLQALDDFKDIYPQIVEHLKELNKKAIVINKISDARDIAATMTQPSSGTLNRDTIASGVLNYNMLVNMQY